MPLNKETKHTTNDFTIEMHWKRFYYKDTTQFLSSSSHVDTDIWIHYMDAD